jgi:predicted metalloprotease
MALPARLSSAAIALLLTVTPAVPAQAAWTPADRQAVARTLEKLWRQIFRTRPPVAANPPALYEISSNDPATLSASLRSPCGEVRLAHYCLRDRSIYYDEQQLGQVAMEYGDAAAFLALLHEYGHAVQHQIGLLSRKRTLKSIELQADCLAGAQMTALDRLGMVEPGDLEEAVASYKRFGDYARSSRHHHGTPGERSAAFLIGVRRGANACLQPPPASTTGQPPSQSSPDA